jgi:hypothetical protein
MFRRGPNNAGAGKTLGGENQRQKKGKAGNLGQKNDKTGVRDGVGGAGWAPGTRLGVPPISRPPARSGGPARHAAAMAGPEDLFDLGGGARLGDVYAGGTSGVRLSDGDGDEGGPPDKWEHGIRGEFQAFKRPPHGGTHWGGTRIPGIPNPLNYPRGPSHTAFPGPMKLSLKFSRAGNSFPKSLRGMWGAPRAAPHVHGDVAK